MEKTFKLITHTNGIRVALFKMESVKSVALKVMLTAGPILEDKTNNGGSHFLEHIVLDGTKSFPSKLAFANELEKLGVSYGGYTATQEMGFEFDVPYINIYPTLKLAKEILFDPVFSDDIIKKERTVILEEMRDKNNSPDFQFYYTCIDHRYKEKEHPLTRKVIGTEEIIQHITKAELLDLYHKIFIPSNIYICVTGNFDMKHMEDEIQNLFSGYQSQHPFVRPSFSNDDLSDFVSIAYPDDKFSNVYTSISFPGFPTEMPVMTELSLKIFSSMFAGLRTSRLFQDVREKEGLVYNVGSDWYTSWGLGTFAISFESDSLKLDRILEIIFRDIEDVQKDGFSFEELEHMKNYLNNRTLLGFSSPWKINQWLLDYLFNDQKILFPEELIEMGSMITHEHINAVIQYLFNFERMNIIMMGKLDNFDLDNSLASILKKKKVLSPPGQKPLHTKTLRK